MIVLNWEIANASNDDGPCLGSVGWNIKRDGWAGFLANHVEPALEWCPEASILIHHPFGQYATEPNDPMHLDGWDYANSVAPWLTNGFATKDGWKSVTKRVACYAYLGGVNATERLRSLPPAELHSLIRRNLKPIKDAGFRGVFIDAAETAIVHPFKHPTIKAQSCARSLDTLTLEIADSIFPERAGIEAAPRSFDDFKPLHSRTVVIKDSLWRERYDPALRHANWQALGYDRSVLTGKVWRTLPYSDDVRATVEAAKAISAEGDVACVCPQPFIQQGVKASELVEGSN